MGTTFEEIRELGCGGKDWVCSCGGEGKYHVVGRDGGNYFFCDECWEAWIGYR